jgi:pilus assembly protein Flp/PilA
MILKFFRSRSAATSIEYALVASLIALVIVSSLMVIGTKVSAKFTPIANNLN